MDGERRGISRALCVFSPWLRLVLGRACGGGGCCGVLALRDNDTSRSEGDGGQAVVEGRTGELAIIITSQGCEPFGHPIVLCGFVSDSSGPYAALLATFQLFQVSLIQYIISFQQTNKAKYLW